MKLGGHVIPRETILAPALVLALAVPVAAQRAPVGAAEQQLRYQLQTFAAVLQAAVRNGGDAFAREQAEFIPAGVQLTADDPQVRGFAPPQGGGLLFYVSVPSIRPMITQVLVQWPRPALPEGLQPTGGVQRGGAAIAQALPAPDPMTASPVIDDGRCATRVRPPAESPNFNYEYSVAVCDALMDAILDGSGTLRVEDEDWLTVAAADGEPDPTPLLNSSTGYTTYLSIRGTDLVAYRQGRITKEEARKLVNLMQR